MQLWCHDKIVCIENIFLSSSMACKVKYCFVFYSCGGEKDNGQQFLQEK
jgi:hypothetical protein